MPDKRCLSEDHLAENEAIVSCSVKQSTKASVKLSWLGAIGDDPIVKGNAKVEAPESCVAILVLEDYKQ